MTVAMRLPLISKLIFHRESFFYYSFHANIYCSFQAIQMQLRGPVPSELYHRYVAFRPIIAGIFTAKSLGGKILSKTLHHQHRRIYNFDRSTEHGTFSEPCLAFTQKFLEFIHYGRGGRIFTYVLTLDGQIRFTETGKEFGIDLLSKHTMHSDVSTYIAFSGEFFLRPREDHHPHSLSTESQNGANVKETDQDEEAANTSHDPAKYVLFIDNDSGTYRPNGEKLPLLREFLESNFVGLNVTTLDSQADSELMGRMKDEQREIKKKQGGNFTYLQQKGSSSSLSSSDEEELNERANKMSLE